MPAVSSASLEAHSAKGNTRETCLRSFFSTHASSSKSLTSPAIWTSIAEESKREIRRTPLRPSRLASANAGVPTPFGLTTPIPVITQRLFIEVLASLHESLCSGRPSSACSPHSNISGIRPSAGDAENDSMSNLGHPDRASGMAAVEILVKAPGPPVSAQAVHSIPKISQLIVAQLA